MTAILLSLPLAGPGIAQDGAQGDRPEHGERAKRGERAERAAMFRRIREKMKAGEELTEPERQTVERMRARKRQMAEQGEAQPGERKAAIRRNRGARGGRAGMAALTINFNIVDQSHFQRAQIFTSKAEHDKAIGALTKVVETSKDPVAVSVAHMTIARIYEKQLDKPEKAAEHYKKITSEKLAVQALSALVKPLLDQGNLQGAIDALAALTQVADKAETKVRLIRAMHAMVRRLNDQDVELTFLEKVPLLISAEEAVVAAAAAKKTREEAAKKRAEEQKAARKGPPWARGGFAGGAGKRGANGGRKMAAGGKRAMAREGKGPRGKKARKGKGGEAAAKIRKEIKELEGAGFFDQAEKLKSKLRKLGVAAEAKAPAHGDADIF